MGLVVLLSATTVLTKTFVGWQIPLMRGDVTDKLDDLFWFAGIPPMSAPELEEHLEGERQAGEMQAEWDELSHIQEQYNIKCDELKIAMMENRRLSLIIINNGLENLLEIEDGEENNEESDEQEDSD